MKIEDKPASVLVEMRLIVATIFYLAPSSARMAVLKKQ